MLLIRFEDFLAKVPPLKQPKERAAMRRLSRDPSLWVRCPAVQRTAVNIDVLDGWLNALE